MLKGIQEILPRAGNEPYGSDFFLFYDEGSRLVNLISNFL